METTTEEFFPKQIPVGLKLCWLQYQDKSKAGQQLLQEKIYKGMKRHRGGTLGFQAFFSVAQGTD